MRTELPIACTLEQSELADRLALMRELGEDSLIGVEVEGARAVLRFAGSSQRVDDLVEAESRCCNFLEFAVTTDGGETSLRVRAPDAAAQVLRGWVGAIAGERLPA